MPAGFSLSRGGQAVKNLSEATPKRSAPQAALSIEISRLVSRVLSGETLDTAASGDELALRFPDAGMSGAMIAEAIVRATGMMGMIREGGAPGTTGDRRGTPPFGEELAAALDADTGEVVAGQAAGARRPNGGDAAEMDAEETGKAERGPGAFTARAAVAAFRRAFFRG
jgi:hypothetical protein